MAIDSLQAQQIASLYIGFYDRAPDPVGLNYWLQSLADGVSLDDIADSFAASPEAADTYPYIKAPNLFTPDQMITEVYQNVLGRVPDADGLAYYSGRLASGESVGHVLASIIGNAATNDNGEFPDQGILANKVSAGLYWAEKALAAQAAIYEADGATLTQRALDSAHAVLDGVTADPASVAEANGEADAFFISGHVYELTEGADLGAHAGQPFYGTDGDDLYLAGTVNSGGVNGNTLGTGDVLDGAGGRDTLKVVHDGASPLAPHISNIEVVSVEASMGGVDLDMRNAFGVDTVESNRSNAPVTFDNVLNNVLISLNQSTADVEVNFAGPVITDGSLNIALVGSQHVETGGTVFADVADSEVTTLNVDSTGVTHEGWWNDLTVAIGNNDADLETLNVTGDSAAYIEDNSNEFRDLTSVVVTNSGDTWVYLYSNEADISIAGGAGNDTFELNANEVDGNDTFDGGDGNDNLWLHFDDSVDLLPSTGPADPISPVIAAVNNATNFKALTIDIGDAWDAGAGTDISLDASLFTTINHFNFSNWAADDLSGPILVNNVANNDSFSFWADINGGAEFNAATGATTLNFDMEGDAHAPIAINGFTTANIEIDNADSDTYIDALVMTKGTTAVLTGATEFVDVWFGDAEGLTLDASGLETEGKIKVDRSGPVTVITDTSEANYIAGGGGSDTLIGTAQDDVLNGGSIFVPAADGVSTINVNNLYNLSDPLAGLKVDVDGATFDVSGSSAAGIALALTGKLIDAGYDASAAGGVVTITSADQFAAVVNNVNAVVDPAVTDIAGPTGTHTPNGEVTAVATEQTLTFSQAEGAYGIGDVIAYDFTDGAGNPVGAQISYTVTAADVVTGNPVQTAANVASQFLAAYLGDAALAAVSTASRTGDTITIESTNAGSTGANQNIHGTEATDTSNAVTPAIETAGVDGIAPNPETFAFNNFSAVDAGHYVFTVDGVSVGFDAVAGGTITGIQIADALEAAGGTIQSDGAGNNTVGFVTDNATPPVITATFDGTAVDVAQSNDGVDADPATAGDNIVTSVDGADQTVFTADTYTGGAGTDLFVVQTTNIEGLSAGDAAKAADVITDFHNGEDLIAFDLGGVAGEAANYAEGPVGGHGNFNGGLAQANSDFQTFAGLVYSAQQVGSDVYIFADTDHNQFADQVVHLTGVTLADLSNDGSFIVA